jgi:PPK2 family polyphosphate:nucleotide phosphotransferase
MQMARRLREILEGYRITSGKGFRLKHVDTADTGGLLPDKQEAKDLLQDEVGLLPELQEKLYAQNRWALLLVLQGMDAAGKDGAVKHVMSGVNPQGCQVSCYKAPSEEELDHDYLWRTNRVLPKRGQIGIFNRSYYEEVLVVRVHQEVLARERVPPQLLGKKLWKQRYQDIRVLERYLGRNGIGIRKCYLHLSRAEQRKRFLERLENKEKQWKYSLGDFYERQFWDRYMEAYEDAIRATATEKAPWYVIPADNKWFTRLVVAAAVNDALERMNLAYPVLDAAHRRKLGAVRATLEAEGNRKKPKP